MSEAALRYYNSTLAYTTALPERRLRDFRKQIRTRLSRRRFKQGIQQTLHRLRIN